MMRRYRQRQSFSKLPCTASNHLDNDDTTKTKSGRGLSALLLKRILPLLFVLSSVQFLNRMRRPKYSALKAGADLRRKMLLELRNSRERLKTTLGKPEVALPNVLIMQAGSTAVGDWLYRAGACHPQVFDGEPDFFDSQTQFFDTDSRYEQGIQFYMKRFEKCVNDDGKGLMLDASTTYFEYPQRVYDLYTQPEALNALDNLKLIFVIRDPLELELSIYNEKKKAYFEAEDKMQEGSFFSGLLKADGELMSFEEYGIKVLRKMIQIQARFHKIGLYGQHFQEWTKLFKRNQILVLSYEEVRSNYKKLQWRIEQFLQVRMNELGGIGLPDDDPRRGDLSTKAIRLLEPMFHQSNEMLYDFLNDKSRPSMEQHPFPRFAHSVVIKTHFDTVLPNILFIGFQKSGTSAIADWMFDNGVCNPTLFEGEPYFFFKEPHFFDRNERFEEGISFYSKRFEQCVDVGLDRFIMDATPNTFEYPDRVHEIYSLPEARGMMKKVKIMLVLRDPIDRDLSAYNHKVFDYKAIIENDPNFDAEGTFYQDTVHAGGAIKNFTEFAKFTTWYYQEYRSREKIYRKEDARYITKVKKWANLFGRERMLIMSYDELKRDPSKVQWRVQQFLGAKFAGELGISNDSGGASKIKKIPDDAIKVLDPHYRPYNEQLYKWLDENPGPDMEERPFPRFPRFENATQ